MASLPSILSWILTGHLLRNTLHSQLKQKNILNFDGGNTLFSLDIIIRFYYNTANFYIHNSYFILKVLSATFFASLLLQNLEEYFSFYFKGTFHSQENYILELYNIFKFHDVIRYLSKKRKINFVE